MKVLVDGDEFHVYVVHEVDELEEELPAPCSFLPLFDTVDESVDINDEGSDDNDSNSNGGDTNNK